MKPKDLALWSVLINLLLAIIKLLAGIFSGCLSLITESVRSLLDAFSSIIAYFGIRLETRVPSQERIAKQQKYEKYIRSTIILLLFAASGWIIFEAISTLVDHRFNATFTYFSLVVMFASAIVNEIMARLKFYYGSKYASIALISDAEHSRINGLTSAVLFLGLALISVYNFADSVLAILLGLYIFYEAWQLGHEVSDSLVNRSNPELGERLKMWLEANKIKYDDLKTRRLGSNNFVSFSLIYNSKKTLEEIDREVAIIEKRLADRFLDLKEISIKVGSRKLTENLVASSLGELFQCEKKA
ncbi:MAG: cation diffusion facilitator family transporter [Patescibacteria group bacterium]